MRLVGDDVEPRLIVTRTGVDLTDKMHAWADHRVAQPEGDRLDGFVFKSRSPSCGRAGVKLYDEQSRFSPAGVGLFAKHFTARFPLVPVEDEARLQQAGRRARFIERVFVLRRWRAMIERERTATGLARFHGTHELLLMAHSPDHALRLARQVAGAGTEGLAGTLDLYFHGMSQTLERPLSRSKHVNVLQHCLDHFERRLTAHEKAEGLALIAQYEAGHMPFVEPVALIKHYVHKYEEPYLRTQHYLRLHPLELTLHTHD